MIVRQYIARWVDDCSATGKNLVVSYGSKESHDRRFDPLDDFDQGCDAWGSLGKWLLASCKTSIEDPKQYKKQGAESCFSMSLHDGLQATM